MENSRRFELPVDIHEEEYFHDAIDDGALFSPAAKKAILVISFIMLALIGLAVLVSKPITIIPFALVVLAIHYYRKMSKSYYRKQNRKHRKI